MGFLCTVSDAWHLGFFTGQTFLSDGEYSMDTRVSSTFFYKSVLEAWNILTVSRTQRSKLWYRRAPFLKSSHAHSGESRDILILAFMGAGITKLGDLLDHEVGTGG